MNDGARGTMIDSTAETVLTQPIQQTLRAVSSSFRTVD